MDDSPEFPLDGVEKRVHSFWGLLLTPLLRGGRGCVICIALCASHTPSPSQEGNFVSFSFVILSEAKDLNA